MLRSFSPHLAAACLLLTACSGGTTISSTQNDPSQLKLLYWQAPTILNPHLSTGFKDWEASRITLEPLATFDPNSQLVPVLAAEIPSRDNGGLSADGLSVTWKLKPDLQWSDGTPFTAADVVFTYEFITDPAVGATNAGVFQGVETVVALDDTTVQITFKEVTPAWFSVLSVQRE